MKWEIGSRAEHTRSPEEVSRYPSNARIFQIRSLEIHLSYLGCPRIPEVLGANKARRNEKPRDKRGTERNTEIPARRHRDTSVSYGRHSASHTAPLCLSSRPKRRM